MILTEVSLNPKASQKGGGDATWMAIFAILTGYIGESYFVYGIILGVLVARIFRLKFGPTHFLCVCVVGFYFLIKLLSIDIVSALLLVKYLFGYTLLFFLFSSKNYRLDFNRIVLVLALAVLVESLLVNSIVPAEMLPNYPKDETGRLAHPGLFWGWYQRPYGFGANASVTATTLVILLSLHRFPESGINKKFDLTEAVTLLAVLVCLSGAGIFLLLLYFAVRMHHKLLLSLAVYVSVLVGLLFAVIFGLGFEVFEKISSNYIQHLIEFKREQLASVFLAKNGVHEWLFGDVWSAEEVVILGGDFGWLNLLQYGGFFAILLTILLAFAIYSSATWLTVLFFLATGFHYFSIFTLTGHIVIGYLLARKVYDRKNKSHA